MATIRIGIIGAGANTRDKHIPGLQAIEGVEIVGVCNRSRESSEAVARTFGISKTYEHWQEVIDDPDVDAVVIGTWPDLHCRASVAALESEKHVLTEARMAMNAREANTMLDAAQERPDLIAQIVPSPMTLRVDRTVNRLLAEGYVGELLVVDHRQRADFLDRDGPLHWRQNMELSGLNIMMMGIYYEAFMRWVGEATRVSAMGKTFVKNRRDRSGHLTSVRIPEHVDVIADLACGAQMHLQQSAVTALVDGDGTYLVGSDGVLRVVGDRLYGVRRGDSALEEVSIPKEEMGAWRVEEEFIAAIRGEEAVTHTTFEDGVKYMEFTEAVAESMATGEAVTLPLF